MIKKWQGERYSEPFTFPFMQQVGVGGLEPPTSASQTRRASRLRYTPADKSIIRSMDKRQDAAAVQLNVHHGIILVIVMVLLIGACQPAASPTATIPPTAALEQTPSQTPILLAATASGVAAPGVTPEPQATLTFTPTPDCLSTGGTLQMGTFSSQILAADFNYRVYLPPCYHTSPSTHYPVLYLLHGLLSDNEQWVQLGLVETMNSLIADGQIPPFIVVLPEEKRMSPPQTSAFPDALVEELVPWIESRYQALPEREFRAIGGLSRGAAWAVQIGFEHPHVFGAIGAHSLPLFQADGGKVRGWLTQLPPQDLPKVFVDIGRSDQERQSAEDFAAQLDEFQITHHWYLFTGGHTESYWSSHLEFYLQWYASNW